MSITKAVMVVDDDRDIRETVADALSMEGYGVYCAENGKVALDKLHHMEKENLPGCIFLDILMPVMNGNEFLEEIDHEEHEVSEIPIVVTSANFDLKKINMKHVFKSLKKPFDINQIFDVAHKFCGDPYT